MRNTDTTNQDKGLCPLTPAAHQTAVTCPICQGEATRNQQTSKLLAYTCVECNWHFTPRNEAPKKARRTIQFDSADTTKESFEGAALELPAAHQSAVRIDLDTWHELRQAVANRKEWVRKMIEACDGAQERDEWAAKLATLERLGEQLLHAKTIEIG